MYNSQGIGSDLCLAKISNFNSFIAESQEHQTPVFALTPEQIGQHGIVLEKTLGVQEEFKKVFSTLTDRVIELTCYAVSN
jgi:hypothetical protein